MNYSTTNTYTLKREILSFTNKVYRRLSKPGKKFTDDMTYGILASGSCLLTDIVDQLHEKSKNIHSVERLTRHLNQGIPAKALKSYLSLIRRWTPDEPVVHIDDSDIVKPGAVCLKTSASSGTAPKAQPQKVSMKKAVM